MMPHHYKNKILMINLAFKCHYIFFIGICIIMYETKQKILSIKNNRNIKPLKYLYEIFN